MARADLPRPPGAGGQPHPFPEMLIDAAPEAWFRLHTCRQPRPAEVFHPDALDHYPAAVRRPEMICGMCEDYRAAAGIDLLHDRASRASRRKLQCPLLAHWGGRGKLGEWYEPLAIWRRYSGDEVGGGALDSGHYLAEEAPAAVIERLTRFFA